MICWFDSVGTVHRYILSSRWMEISCLSWRAPKICKSCKARYFHCPTRCLAQCLAQRIHSLGICWVNNLINESPWVPCKTLGCLVWKATWTGSLPFSFHGWLLENITHATARFLPISIVTNIYSSVKFPIDLKLSDLHMLFFSITGWGGDLHMTPVIYFQQIKSTKQDYKVQVCANPIWNINF